MMTTATHTDFERIVHVGMTPSYGGRSMHVYCKIQYRNGELSITGVEGPLASGNALGNCGQIEMNWEPMKTYAPGWNRALEAEFLAVWRKWHLNNMNAGCTHQDERGEKWATHPSAICPDCGWKLGHGWSKREVPEDVLEFLQSLPDTDRTPAWV